MSKLFRWLDKGVQEAIENYWTHRSMKQYFRDFMFSLFIWPMLLLRFFTEPVFLATLAVVSGVYWGLTLILQLT